MSKIRTLLLLHGLTLNGAPKVILETFEALSDATEIMTITLAGGPHEDRCRRLGPLYLYEEAAPPMGRRQRLLQMLSGQRRQQKRTYGELIAAFQPELVFVNSIASLPLLRCLPLPAQVPLLLHVHELRSYQQKYLKLDPVNFLERPDHYIACSGAVRDALTGDCGIAPSRISVIHEFVAEKTAWPAPVPPRPLGGPEKIVVGGAGFPVWIKGSVLFVQMAAELVRLLGSDRVRFVYVGVNEEENSWQMQEMARKLGVYENIEFIATTSEPLKHFASYDIFVSSSWEDPCPITVLENMMLEKPVLCYAGSGGAPEEVGDTGVVVPGFSPQAMAQAVAELAADPARRLAMGRAARERVKAHFTDTVQTPKILNLIQQLARPSAPRTNRAAAIPPISIPTTR